MANPVAADSRGNIDEQISQLMQCKPLSEQEVDLFYYLVFTPIRENKSLVFFFPREIVIRDGEFRASSRF